MTPGTGKFFPDKKPKTPDIVARMREELCGPHDDETCDICEIFTDAINEIERLRTVGDALAHGIRTAHWDDALDAWTELREGGNQ
mgnify:CR=1 FL=1